MLLTRICADLRSAVWLASRIRAGLSTVTAWSSGTQTKQYCFAESRYYCIQHDIWRDRRSPHRVISATFAPSLSVYVLRKFSTFFEGCWARRQDEVTLSLQPLIWSRYLWKWTAKRSFVDCGNRRRLFSWRTRAQSWSIKTKMTQIFNVVVRTAGDGYDCGCRGSTRDDNGSQWRVIWLPCWWCRGRIATCDNTIEMKFFKFSSFYWKYSAK